MRRAIFAWAILALTAIAVRAQDAVIAIRQVHQAPDKDGVYYAGDGGTATSVELFSPLGVTVDASGNIYIADSGNNRIRKVTASTGIITTVAGNGTAGSSGDGGAATSAELSYPTAVVVDSPGNVYIADYNNNKVRTVGSITK